MTKTNSEEEKLAKLSRLLADFEKNPKIKEKAWKKIEEWRKKLRQSTAEVYSAIPLSDKDLTLIKDYLSIATGKPVFRVNNIVSPEILGGLKVIINNKIYDSSLFGQLEKMQTQFKKMIRS